MLFKKLLLMSLIASSACNLRAATSHEIRTWGIVITSVVSAWTGLHVLARQHYDMSQKIFDVFLGFALIAAGISGIVMSDRISHFVERQFH